MALQISREDRQRLREVTAELLSPLKHVHGRQWAEAVEVPLMRLLGADGAVFAFPENEDLQLWSLSVPAPVLQGIAAFGSGLAPGRLRSSDPVVDRVLALRKATKLDVHTDGLLRPLIGESTSPSPLVEEVLRPAGIRHHAGMRTALDLGEADLVATFGEGDHAPQVEQARIGFLELLHPAFAAGVRQRVLARSWPRELGRCLDALEQPVVLVDFMGAELHRTRELTDLLRDDGERDWILAAARALGRDMGRLYRRTRKSDPAPSLPLGERELQTPTGRYRVRGTFLIDERAVHGRLGLISVTRLGLRLPTARGLVGRFDLTPRQAEVALLLARGLSDQEVAERLIISPHTVRTHAMQLFRKLGIHSRSALALRLCALEPEAFGPPGRGPSAPGGV